MNNDPLVTRLNVLEQGCLSEAGGDEQSFWYEAAEACHQAAAEIERLRAALAEAQATNLALIDGNARAMEALQAQHRATLRQAVAERRDLRAAIDTNVETIRSMQAERDRDAEAENGRLALDRLARVLDRGTLQALTDANDRAEKAERERDAGVELLTEEQQRHNETQRALIIANTTQANLRQHISVAHQALRKCRLVLCERWAKPEARSSAIKAVNAVMGERDE